MNDDWWGFFAQKMLFVPINIKDTLKRSFDLWLGWAQFDQSPKWLEGIIQHSWKYVLGFCLYEKIDTSLISQATTSSGLFYLSTKTGNWVKQLHWLSPKLKDHSCLSLLGCFQPMINQAHNSPYYCVLNNSNKLNVHLLTLELHVDGFFSPIIGQNQTCQFVSSC